MIEPNGNEHWGYTQYVEIDPINSYVSLDAFSNEHGEINTDLPRASWIVTFTDMKVHTLVQTVVTYGSLADLEAVINMGMEAGITSTLERLDVLLESLFK